MGNPFLFTCRPVNLLTRLPGFTGPESNKGEQRIMEIHSCSQVDLSTCLPGLTGPEVIIGEQGIMGIAYLSICRHVNLYTNVDRSRGKYRSARHYGHSVLTHIPQG